MVSKLQKEKYIEWFPGEDLTSDALHKDKEIHVNFVKTGMYSGATLVEQSQPFGILGDLRGVRCINQTAHESSN